MTNINKKKTGLIACICLSILLLSGCTQVKTPEIITNSTITILNKGRIISYLGEDLDKDYYKLEELSKMVIEESVKYNSAFENNPINVISVKMAEGSNDKVIVTTEYSDHKVYKETQEKDFFWGTIAEAKEAGYDLKVTLVSVKDNNTSISSEEISAMDKNHILIIEDNVNVRCPSKVLYLDKNSSVNEDGIVKVSDAEGLSYIITK